MTDENALHVCIACGNELHHNGAWQAAKSWATWTWMYFALGTVITPGLHGLLCYSVATGNREEDNFTGFGAGFGILFLTLMFPVLSTLVAQWHWQTVRSETQGEWGDFEF